VAAADDDGTEQTITSRAAEVLTAQPEASAHLLLVLVENAAPATSALEPTSTSRREIF